MVSLTEKTTIPLPAAEVWPLGLVPPPKVPTQVVPPKAP